MTLKEWLDNNWLKLKDKIDWEWDRYWDWQVSVTTILQIIEDPWFEYVKRNHAEAVEAACERWKAIHSWAEDFFSAKAMAVDKRILKFHVLHDVRVTWMEKTYFKEWVRWSVDLEAYVDWLEKNVDYKSSAKKNPKYHLQITWYYWLNWKGWGILYLWKSYEYVEVDVVELLPVFLELKEYFFCLLWQPYCT